MSRMSVRYPEDWQEREDRLAEKVDEMIDQRKEDLNEEERSKIEEKCSHDSHDWLVNLRDEPTECRLCGISFVRWVSSHELP